MRGLAVLTLGITFGATIPAVAQNDAATVAADALKEWMAPGLRVVITQDVYDELGRLADTLRLETVRCLIGAAQGDSLLVDFAWAPHIESSTPESVQYRLCPVATIALWHNHPLPPDASGESSCYLSRIDIEEALQSYAPLIQMVQVNAEVACWWSRAQVALHADAEFVLPFPDQARGQTVHAGAAACTDDCTASEPCLKSLPGRETYAAEFTQRQRFASVPRLTGGTGMKRFPSNMDWGMAPPRPATAPCARGR